jgi:hypothetical protein
LTQQDFRVSGGRTQFPVKIPALSGTPDAVLSGRDASSPR